MKLILMRGVSGSGKSTLARKIAGEIEGSVILSTDDYFMFEGRYVFDPSKLALYHEMNRERAMWAMREKTPCVIIDNTNTQAWEMKPYVEAALEHSYEIEIRVPEPVDIEEIMHRQAREKNLSREIVERMLERWEEVTVEDLIRKT